MLSAFIGLRNSPLRFLPQSRLQTPAQRLELEGRTRAKAEPLARIGGTVVDHLSDLKSVDVLFSIVATGKDVQDVLYGKNGVCSQGGKIPPIIVDCSTIAVEDSARHMPSTMPEGDGIPAQCTSAPIAKAENTTCTSPTPKT